MKSPSQQLRPTPGQRNQRSRIGRRRKIATRRSGTRWRGRFASYGSRRTATTNEKITSDGEVQGVQWILAKKSLTQAFLRVVFVSHKGNPEKPRVSIRTLCDNLRQAAASLKLNLEEAGWQSEDIALAAYAQSVALLANASSVTGCENDLEALKTLEKVIKETMPEFRVTTRTSL